MSFKRVGILLGKEFRYGFKGYIFIFSIVAPIVISVMVTLMFGSLFSGKAELGVLSEGESQVIPALQIMMSRRPSSSTTVLTIFSASA